MMAWHKDRDSFLVCIHQTIPLLRAVVVKDLYSYQRGSSFLEHLPFFRMKHFLRVRRIVKDQRYISRLFRHTCHKRKRCLIVHREPVRKNDLDCTWLKMLDRLQSCKRLLRARMANANLICNACLFTMRTENLTYLDELIHRLGI